MSRNKNNILFLRRQFTFEQKGDIAHYIHDAQCANAAAELGYNALLVFVETGSRVKSPLSLFILPKPAPPSQKFKGFYRVGDRVRVLEFPISWPLDSVSIKGLSGEALSIAWYLNLFVKRGASLVHTQDLLLAEIAVKAGIPVVYEQHYFGKAHFKEKLVRSPLFKLAIVQSDITKQHLVANGMPEEKVRVMHNGFNKRFLERMSEAAEAWREKLLRPGEKYLVVYSGALYDFKGVDILIDIAKDMPEIRFALTGGGEEKLKRYRSLLRDKAIGNVTFHGWLESQNELTALFQAADIMAHPHHTRHGDYTNPVKFFQYLASGTPIALTDLPFVEEFKDKGLAIEVCDPDDPEAYKECLRRTLSRRPRKEKGYIENIEFAKNFTWEKRMKMIFAAAGVRLKERKGHIPLTGL